MHFSEENERDAIRIYFSMPISVRIETIRLEMDLISKRKLAA